MEIESPSSAAARESDADPQAPSEAPAVLQVVPALGTGGVERGTTDIASALVKAGFRAYVASRGGRLVHDLERVGATHVTLPVHSKNPFVMLRNIDRLGALIVRHDIAIVHARSRAPAWSAYIAARRHGRAFVTTFHGTYDTSNSLKTWYNSVMIRGTRVIAISRFIAQHIRTTYEINAARIATVPRGVSIDLFDPAAVSAERMAQLAVAWRLSDDVPMVLMPGRLTRWKGQAVLIEAIARLGRQAVRCVIVGDDQGRTRYRHELENLVRRLGLEETVRIMEHCHDMPAAYMLADVVVSASTDPEAFGRVAAEAQAMGRPVVATNHGAARETVVPGTTGWLVPPGNVAALAEGLDYALGLGEAERQDIAAAARRHIAENYTVEKMCETTLDLYRDLLPRS